MRTRKGVMDMVRIPVLILIFLSPFCQSSNQLTQTKPLFPKDMLISEGGDFALGFISPTNSSNKLYIGIWYHNIPERTVVWVANRDNPITTPSSSAKLAVSNNSELVLSDSQGHTLWMTTTNNIASGGAGASAVLLNSGNFVLQSPNGTIVWQSFDHPTDTMLPTMRVMLSYKGKPAMHLSAWKGPDDPSTGEISYSMDPTSDALQLFIWNGTLPYIRSSVLSDFSVSGGAYHSNGTSIMYQEMVVDTGDKLYFTYTVSAGSPYTHFSLHYTGRMKFMSWNNTKSSWAVIDETPKAGCHLYASCGLYGYCDHTEAMIPTCQCPDGFEHVESLNFSRGCWRKEPLKCGDEDNFMTMPNMKLPDKFLHIRNRSFDQCAAECSKNCSCMAYAYANLSNTGAVGDTSRCLVWTGDLIDMEKASYLENLYIRLGKSPVQNKSNLPKILFPIIACLLLFTSGVLVWTCKNRGKRQKKKVQKRKMLEYLSSTDEVGDKNIEIPFISFENIVTATDNFSDCNMLGKGGFGKVYKRGHGRVLLGCCIHEDEKLLVYEYLPNKSLDYFLFGRFNVQYSTRRSMLQWTTRFKIIQGVARGIMYLHQDSRLTIIHRDLKASNILLDKEMSPKISDFGMARIFCGDQLQASTNRVVGTYGYMSPEYAMEGAFSVKSDTYSFGVLLLEIISGLKISSPHLIMDFPNLIVYAWNLWKDGKIEDLVDTSIMENCCLYEVSRCIHIGLLCVQDSPSCRPLMSEVVFMLEDKMKPLSTPKQPIYFALRDYEPREAGNIREFSIYDTSLTALEGR
ncbi:hypothetical protein U9M48_033970 [Paspalum notatum var. saurae]|uniref:Receptor-like serine/threonine-protein kinase n=1 Tax=Paspalum notatum var. saurae TaxID=547442 RepID=A0AAQ3X6D6_PASNO